MNDQEIEAATIAQLQKESRLSLLDTIRTKLESMEKPDEEFIDDAFIWNQCLIDTINYLETLK